LLLFYYLEVFCYFLFILEEGRGAWVFFLVNYFTFEKGRGAWVYLLIIIFLKIYYLYSFVTFFTSWRERLAWVLFFSLFVIFCIVC
jgi:hypothetical protein